MFHDQAKSKTVAVEITLTDGQTISGQMLAGMAGVIETVLNDDGQFIQVVEKTGAQAFLSKAQIASLKPAAELGATPRIQAKTAQQDWWEILEVSPIANAEQVRAAYHEKAKQYHPDRYANGCATEIAEYANRMFRRISDAHDIYQNRSRAA